MPKKRTVQLEEVDNGFVLRVFDSERTARYFPNIGMVLREIERYMTGPPPEGSSTGLLPALREPECALEPKPTVPNPFRTPLPHDSKVIPRRRPIRTVDPADRSDFVDPDAPTVRQ
jgi:hypothetical protein